MTKRNILNGIPSRNTSNFTAVSIFVINIPFGNMQIPKNAFVTFDKMQTAHKIK